MDEQSVAIADDLKESKIRWKLNYVYNNLKCFDLCYFKYNDKWYQYQS